MKIADTKNGHCRCKIRSRDIVFNGKKDQGPPNNARTTRVLPNLLDQFIAENFILSG